MDVGGGIRVDLTDRLMNVGDVRWIQEGIWWWSPWAIGMLVSQRTWRPILRMRSRMEVLSAAHLVLQVGGFPIFSGEWVEACMPHAACRGVLVCHIAGRQFQVPVSRLRDALRCHHRPSPRCRRAEWSPIGGSSGWTAHLQSMGFRQE